MLEEYLVAGTEVVEAWLAIGGMQKTQAGTFAMTGFQPFALAALAGKGFFLEAAESGLLLAIYHLRQSVGKDITQPILRKDKMVATVHIAVMLHDNSMTAFLGIDTDTWCHTHPTGKSGIKDIHEHFAHIVPNPFVEDIAEELSPFGRLNAIGSNGDDRRNGVGFSPPQDSVAGTGNAARRGRMYKMLKAERHWRG